jgi:hypothetical protein
MIGVPAMTPSEDTRDRAWLLYGARPTTGRFENGINGPNNTRADTVIKGQPFVPGSSPSTPSRIRNPKSNVWSYLCVRQTPSAVLLSGASKRRPTLLGSTEFFNTQFRFFDEVKRPRSMLDFKLVNYGLAKREAGDLVTSRFGAHAS